MNRYLMSIMLLLLCGVVNVVSAQSRADSLMAALCDDKCGKSHRGDWRNAPENSLQAIQNCIDMGVDMVEIDLKKTKDGHVILMHDRLIDRTTTGKGCPQDYTLQEIKELWLRNGAGHKTHHKVPTLEEAMSIAKGRILVNIDKGYDYFDEVYDILKKTGTLNQCIIKSEKAYDVVYSEKPEALERMKFMPVVKLSAEDAGNIIDGYQLNYAPEFYELVFDIIDDNVMSHMKNIRESGANVFINSLWPELCGGHHDDRAVELGEPTQSWGWIIECGARLIQTDRPGILLEYLRKSGLHE
ncbi:glycerophosphodiester phosphodiesterase family protein [Muribaculum intestinale]|uniref:glycerophosphodiester phosphodiesterase family protein n=1 Tax=Muribaculum intestinale TaxID=1796646 RepID=UPI0025A98EC4|nr:glycerophosphodiester phosphodiesterase family protein [Muribaculum intestinale]